MLSHGIVGPFHRAVLGALFVAGTAHAQETVRVSVDSSGAQGDDNAWDFPVLSTDSQVVAFVSAADNLVAGDTNAAWDVFVHDRSSGITELVSVDSSGVQGNAVSEIPAITADGQVIAFASTASNLVAGDTNLANDIFVHDRSTGITERVSIDSFGVEADAISDSPSISSDGRFVAFSSAADNLVSGDTNGCWDVFVHDRSTGVTERVSVDSSGAEQNSSCDAYPVSISADGHLVAFSSFATNLVAGDSNRAEDVFVHNRNTGGTQRVSVRSDGHQAYGISNEGQISADGSVVVFKSDAPQLVSGDTNGASDVFVHDRFTQVTDRVSVDSSGAQANGDSTFPSISSDGQIVAFQSSAANLVAGDTNGFWDVFVHDRTNAITQRVSIDSFGAEGNANSEGATISADGRTVAFDSEASNLVAGDTNGFMDVFVHDGPFASWTNYGLGFPGTNGIPSFTSRDEPVIGTSITLDLANSYASPTSGLLFVGFQQTNLPTSWGGDLLVVPALVIPVSFSSGSDTFTGSIPDDPALLGTTVDLQALETDPGAAKGVSFTAGLELVLGY